MNPTVSTNKVNSVLYLKTVNQRLIFSRLEGVVGGTTEKKVQNKMGVLGVKSLKLNLCQL